MKIARTALVEHRSALCAERSPWTLSNGEDPMESIQWIASISRPYGAWCRQCVAIRSRYSHRQKVDYTDGNTKAILTFDLSPGSV